MIKINRNLQQVFMDLPELHLNKPIEKLLIYNIYFNIFKFLLLFYDIIINHKSIFNYIIYFIYM
jgi:hypothetical protein